MKIPKKLKPESVEAIKKLIQQEIVGKSMISFRELFGRESKFRDWKGTPLETLYTTFGEDTGAQVGGLILKEVLMQEQKGYWENIKQSFDGRKDTNEITVYFRHSKKAS